MSRLAADRAAPQAALLTTEKPFMSMSRGGKKLFQVMPGIPAINALEQVSCFLLQAESVLNCVLSLREETEEADFAPLFLIESAGALVNSVVSAMSRAPQIVDESQESESRAVSESPDDMALRYPPNAGAFSVWYNRATIDEGDTDPWAVNDANGQDIFYLPSLQLAQYVAEQLKQLGGTVWAMKGGVR